MLIFYYPSMVYVIKNYIFYGILFLPIDFSSWERSGSVVEMLDSSLRGSWFKPHRRHCVVSLSKNINPSLVLVQPRKTRPYITERLLIGRKESNQTNEDFSSHLKMNYYPATIFF